MAKKTAQLSLEEIVGFKPYRLEKSRHILGITYVIFFEETPIRQGYCNYSAFDQIEDMVELLNTAYHEGMIRYKLIVR